MFISHKLKLYQPTNQRGVKKNGTQREQKIRVCVLKMHTQMKRMSTFFLVKMMMAVT